jgi:putative FmdB family regulatory protein
MPTYEYECRACGHAFEREQRIHEDPVKSCPRCRKDEARRLISRTSFVLKGGGWYSDLYASKPAAKPEGGVGAEAKAGGEKSETSDKAAKTEKAEQAPEKSGGSPKGPSKSAA